MRSPWKSAVMIFVLVVMILAGCGTDNSLQKFTRSGDIHLYSASGGTQEWFDGNYGNALRQKFPNINWIVHFPGGEGTSIQDVVAANMPLDIVFGSISSFHSSILKLDLQTDISDLIKSRKYDLNKLEPTLVQLQRQLANGGIYGLPAFVGTSGLYYNKDLFDKFGVGYPKDKMTWDEVYDLAVRMTRRDGDVQYYGYTSDMYVQPTTNQFSLDPIDPKTFKANINSDSWKRLLQSMVSFLTIPGYDLDRSSLAGNQWSLFNQDGKVAMYAEYSGCCGFTPGEGVPNWDVVTAPTFKEAPGLGPQVYPNYWFLSSISKNRDLAFDIIAYISSEEFQLILNRKGLATVLKDEKIRSQYGKDMAKYEGKNTAALFPKQHAPVLTRTEYHSIAESEIFNVILDVATGTKDMNTALREAAEKINIEIEAIRGLK